MTLLAELAALYASKGLLAGLENPPLDVVCPHCASCWAGAGDARPPREEGRSGISLPWVGPDYRAGGVAILGLNLNDAGALDIEYQISSGFEDGQSVAERLAGGHRTAHNSPFGYRSLRSAAAVEDWLNERTVQDREDAAELVDVLQRTARLQAVKCSPQDRLRSTPTDAMVANCPNYLLERELEVLRPGVIVAFGNKVASALTQLGYDPKEGTDYLSWGTVDIGARAYTVVWLYHPSGRYWDDSQQELLRELPNVARPAPA